MLNRRVRGLCFVTFSLFSCQGVVYNVQHGGRMLRPPVPFKDDGGAVVATFAILTKSDSMPNCNCSTCLCAVTYSTGTETEHS